MLGGSLEVTAIIQDEAVWYKHQQVVYDVYIKKRWRGIFKTLKRFFSQPTAIEYNTAVLEEEYEVK